MADTNDISARDGSRNLTQDDIVARIGMQISATLGSPLTQMAKVMSDMKDTLTKIEKGTVGTGKIGSSSRSSGLDIGFSSRDVSKTAKSLEDIKKYLQKEQIQARRDRQEFSNRASDARTTGIDLVFNKKLEAVFKELEDKIDDISSEDFRQLPQKLQESITKIQSGFLETKLTKESAVADLDDTIRNLNEKLIVAKDALDRAKEKGLDTSRHETVVGGIEKTLEKEREKRESLFNELRLIPDEERQAIAEARSKAIDDARRDAENSAEELKLIYANTFDAVRDAISGTEQLASNSAYIAETIEEREKTKSEQIQDEINKQLEVTRSAIKALENFLEKEKDNLDLEHRTAIETQLENLRKNEEAFKKWTPVKDEMSKAAKSLKSAAESIVKGLLGTAFKRLEDYYLDAYKEGFNKVYDSVENTRNTVSARLRLDQGGFSEMQEEIQAEIEAQGLESSITQADVNDALVSLSAAGVTDTDMLKALALEQAKLAASGSSLNLGNEEALNNIRQMYQAQIQQGATQGEAIDGIVTLLDRVAAQQREIGTSGWDSSLVNGQMDQIFNQMAEIGIAGQKSMDEMAKDITAAMQYSEHYYGMGLDPNELFQYIQDISKGTVASNSTFEKVLQVRGIDRKAILEKGIDELYSEISTVLQDVASTGDTKYRAEVLQAFGLSMTPLDAEKLANGVATIQTTSLEQLDATTKQTQIDMQNGTYLSKTQTHQNEAANAMAEIAIDAEKQYKGNEYVLAGFDAVTNGLNAIENVAEEILMSLISDKIKISGENLNTVGQFAGDFMTGKNNVAGNLGRAATVAVGGYKTISAISDAVSEDGTLKAGVLETDPDFWAGIGTTVGGAAGGPIAGAVVGGLMGGASKIGAAWAEHIETKLDPFEEAVQEFRDSTQQQLKDSVDNLNDVNSTLSKYEDIQKKNNIAEMKNLLMEEANISAQQLRDASDEKIQEMFEDNLLEQQKNLAKEAENQVLLDSILNKNAEVTADLNLDYENLALAETGKSIESMSADEKHDYSKSLIEEHGKEFRGKAKDIISDVGQQISGLTDMSEEDMKAYLVSNSNLGAEEIKKMSTSDLQENIRKSFVESYSDQSKFSDETRILFEHEMDEYEKRHQVYIEAENELQSRWEATKKELQANGETIDNANMVAAYLKKYHGSENLANLKSDATKDIILDSSGSVTLDPGMLYKESYSFASGLTNVPYDNYPALLHEGERILTAKEAQAYNEMSSFAVSNLSNAYNSNYDTSSNVFATTGYGTGIETSIKDQTSSVLQKLDQVIDAIKALSISISTGGSAMSAAHRNVIRGNSNITQLNTL